LFYAIFYFRFSCLLWSIKNEEKKEMQSAKTSHWRHGDIMIGAVDSLPKDAVVRAGAPVLAWGEVTGHSHRIEDPSAVVFYQLRGEGYFTVNTESVRLVHEEHGPIVLPQGTYHFWHQREYTPGAIRRVVD
jgi:hypothetical protein